MHLYDAHAHLADARLAPVERVLDEAAAAGVRGILACAARMGEWDAIAALSRRPGVLGAIGLHPFFVRDAPTDLAARLRQALAAGANLAAVGEIGLDFWEGRSNARAQYDALAAQLGAARDLGLPVVLHNRRSWNEFFAILRDSGIASLRGLCHAFGASREIARKVLDLGLMISFCGPITYPNARRLREAAAYVPLDRVLTETDCPDLPPEPYRGGLSFPWHVRHVVEAIAAVKGLAPATVAEQVEANFAGLFARVPRPGRAGGPPQRMPPPRPSAPAAADGADSGKTM